MVLVMAKEEMEELWRLAGDLYCFGHYPSLPTRGLPTLSPAFLAFFSVFFFDCVPGFERTKHREGNR